MRLLKLILLNTSLVLAACSPSVPMLTPDLGPRGKVTEDVDLLTIGGAVDILFVVDNSGSMMSHQANLAKNIGGFVANFNKVGQIDYHIGVISSDSDGIYGGPCCGRLVGQTKYITPFTPDGLKILEKNILIGSDGSGTEKMFDPIRQAFTTPLVNGLNRGFLRSQAYLAIIFITDAEDQSQIGVDEFFKFLVGLKGQSSNILGYGVLIPSGADESVCYRDESGAAPLRTERFLSMVANAGKNVLSLCDQRFGTALATMGADLASHLGRDIVLSRAPIPSSIEVYFGTRRLDNDYETGWTFDPERNAIIIGRSVDWTGEADGARLRVVFEPAEYKF